MGAAGQRLVNIPELSPSPVTLLSARFPHSSLEGLILGLLCPSEAEPPRVSEPL